MSAASVSMQVEWRRYRRTKMLIGLVFSFVFCGLAAPPLALYMSDLIASAGVDQIIVKETEVGAVDSAAMFTQNVGQVAVLVVMGMAVTALGWDARAGSSIFYRIRSQRLGPVVVPRLVLCWLVSIASLVVATALWAISTSVSIEAPPASMVAKIVVAMAAYSIMCASLGFLLMAWLRRVAAALGTGVGIVLFLPLIAPITQVESSMPTALMTAHQSPAGDIVMPVIVSLVVAGLCVVGGVKVLERHTLRRDA